MAKLFQISEAPQRIRLQPIAGAAERFRDRYQRGRVVAQFITGSPLRAIAKREQIPPKLAEQVLREKLAEHEPGTAA